MLKLSFVFKLIFWMCCVALNVLALSPAPYLPPDLLNVWDKAQHAFGFGVLAFWAVLAYTSVSKFRIGMLLLAMGGLIEVMQHLSAYRFGDWQDAVADGVGVLLGLGLVVGLIRLEWFKRLIRINQ